MSMEPAPNADFDEAEQQLLEQARQETAAADAVLLAEAEQSEPAPAPAAPAAPVAAPTAAPAPQAAAPAAAPAAEAKPGEPSPEAAPPAEEQQQGSVKAALRAARRAERKLREENAALKQRLEQHGVKPEAAQANGVPEPDETQLEDVRQYAPEVGKAYEAAKARAEALERQLRELQRNAAPASDPDFVPEVLEAPVQEVVDEIPELLQWHSRPEHADLWAAAKDVDTTLRRAPAWRDKPLAERLVEVVARVKRDHLIAGPSIPPQPAPSRTPLQAAQQVIEQASRAKSPVLTVGDLRGGASPTTGAPDYREMARQGMTDEEIMASLPVQP